MTLVLRPHGLAQEEITIMAASLRPPEGSVKLIITKGPSIVVNIFTYDNSYRKRGEGVQKC